MHSKRSEEKIKRIKKIARGAGDFFDTVSPKHSLHDGKNALSVLPTVLTFSPGYCTGERAVIE